MNAGKVIDGIEGLTSDKLTYYVRAGYIKPRKIKRRSLYYNDFSESDFIILKIACKYIYKEDLRIRAAFKRAEKEYTTPQLPFK